MTKQKSVRWTEREDNFLIKNYMGKTNEQLTGGLMFLTGKFRSSGSISARIHVLGLKGRPHGGRRRKTQNPRHEKPVKLHEIHVPKIKPVLKNTRLFEIFQDKGFNLVDVARMSGMDVDMLRGFVSQGGLPKDCVWAVEKLGGTV